jgi:hypothetical protein
MPRMAGMLGFDTFWFWNPFIKTVSNISFQTSQLGATGNRMITPLDKDHSCSGLELLVYAAFTY